MWEVVSALREAPATEARKVASLAREFGIHERQVVVALDYAAAHRDEVEERIAANDLALEGAERVAAERKHLLA